MKNMKDGWHTLAGIEVYVEDGFVVRGVTKDLSGLGERTIYPYEKSKYGGLDKCKVPVSIFTRRIKNETVFMR